MIIIGIDIASKKHCYYIFSKETGIVFSSSSVSISINKDGYKNSARIF